MYVPPVPFETLLPALEQALGSSPLEVFRELDPAPLGAGSIAQVHDVVRQLRGEAGERQVKDARVAVVSSGGLTPSGALLMRTDT